MQCGALYVAVHGEVKCTAISHLFSFLSFQCLMLRAKDFAKLDPGMVARILEKMKW